MEMAKDGKKNKGRNCLNGNGWVNEMIECDVLIVGAGPAGASLALYLAENNINTVLVEKKSIIDYPVRCAELVTRKIAGLFDFHIMGIDNEVAFMDTYIGDIYTGFKKEAETASPGFILNRNIFVGDLVARFVRKGGRFFGSTSFKSFEAGPGTDKQGIALYDPASFDGCRRNNLPETDVIDFSISVLKTGIKSFLKVKSKIVAGADGPLSFIGRIMGSPDNKFLPGYQQNIACTIADANRARALIFFAPFIWHGYGWLFPKSGSINIGIGMEQETNKETAAAHIKEAFDKFKKIIFSDSYVNLENMELRKKDRIRNADINRTVCGLIPVSGMVKKPVFRNIVLVGDAAGLCNPLTGAGIYNAVYSARLTAPVIAKALEHNAIGILEEIKDTYNSNLGRSLKTASEKRGLLNDLQDGDNISIEAFKDLIKRTWVAFK